VPTDAAIAGILAMAVFGFTGSLHCAAMCGSMSAAACAPSPTSTSKASLQYHAARALTYALLGFATGLLTAMFLTQWLTSANRYLGVGFGLLMLLYALLELKKAVQGAVVRSPADTTQPLFRVAGWLNKNIAALPIPRPVTLGIATALLPCGFLWAALGQAALLAHPVYSAAGMLVFALASSPALLAGAGILTFVNRGAPRKAPIIAALCLVLAAGIVLWRALARPHDHAAHGTHHHVEPAADH